jgi:hypothetical protein
MSALDALAILEQFLFGFWGDAKERARCPSGTTLGNVPRCRTSKQPRLPGAETSSKTPLRCTQCARRRTSR